jgi:catechol 2,3-dioxygenase-like lactoylglutathione lyase family enzyme
MITGMNHFTVIGKDKVATLDFYTSVLGLQVGPRPDLGFDGAWLYAELNQSAILHIYFDRPLPQPPAGAIDHMAFTGTDIDSLKARLDARGLKYKVQLQAGGKTLQLFTLDPNGAKVEVDFAP